MAIHWRMTLLDIHSVNKLYSEGLTYIFQVFEESGRYLHKLELSNTIIEFMVSEQNVVYLLV